MKNKPTHFFKSTQFFKALIFTTFLTTPALAGEIDMNTAQMQAMDKITGRVSIIEVPVGGEIKFGSFSVVVRTCKTRPEEEIPENFAFVDITDKSFDQEEFNIFKGWMISSSPAVHAVEHPIYDVWLLKCINTNVQPDRLLDEKTLQARDELPRLQEIKIRQEEMNKNTFTNEPNNIQIKDSMYKELPPEKEISKPEIKKPGQPQNLLNIPSDEQDFDLNEVEISPDELSQAINAEVQKLKETQENSQEPQNIEEKLTAFETDQNTERKLTGSESDQMIKETSESFEQPSEVDDLSAQIEAELKNHAM